MAPEDYRQGHQAHAVIGLDMILQPAHLIGMYGDDEIPVDFQLSDTLNAFHAYYMNKYIDHHAYTMAF